ncbi:MAG: hypothetical protein BroJett006_12270 [Betaproteobacteria bacterium]|nr:MAG: hypothetical protein BroJett006_12270 [Betaproteobacteria bacterium]
MHDNLEGKIAILVPNCSNAGIDQAEAVIVGDADGADDFVSRFRIHVVPEATGLRSANNWL